MTEISRRSMLKVLGLGAAAAASPLALSSQALAARYKELNILCWEGYNSAQVLDPYRKLTCATVKAESATSDPVMVNKLRAGENKVWDLINVNNAWARRQMWPEHLIKPLPKETFEPFFEKMLPAFKPPYHWAMSADGKELLGMAQRFGPFSFVVNTDKISRATAEEQGWNLWAEDKKPDFEYGILEHDDWNIADTFAICGIDPFKEHTDEEFERFTKTARRVFKYARVIGDVAALNMALVNGDIAAQLAGGTYTSSLARFEGEDQIYSISPKENGFMWVEITSVVNNPEVSPLAEDFLKWVQQPDIAHIVAFAEGTFNPVAQMGNPECLKLFTKEELDCLQWETLNEEMARARALDIVPDYDRAHAIVVEAKRQR